MASEPGEPPSEEVAGTQSEASPDITAETAPVVDDLTLDDGPPAPPATEPAEGWGDGI